MGLLHSCMYLWRIRNAGTKTIKSIQNTVDFVLLVNDESTDSTIKVAEKAFKSSKRCEIGTSISKPSFIILNQQKKGVGAAVCNGFKHILRLDRKVIPVYKWSRGRTKIYTRHAEKRERDKTNSISLSLSLLSMPCTALHFQKRTRPRLFVTG